MDDMTAFERQVAGELVRRAGPVHPVDAAAIFTTITTTTQSPKWRFQSMFSATKFVLAAAIVALFGGLLVAGLLLPSTDREAAPGAVTSAQPSPSTSPSPSPSPDAAREVYEATARLIVDPGPDAGVQDVALAEVALNLYADQATSRPIVEAVIAKLGLDVSPASLLGRISATASGDTLVLSIVAQDDDPEAARDIALAFGDEMRQRVRDALVTHEVKDTDKAIRANEAAIRINQNRLKRLSNKQGKTPEDRDEVQSLSSQISVLQEDIERLRENSSALVRNELVWFEMPTVPEQPLADEWQEAVFPTTDVVVAAQGIEQGTSIEREMLMVRTVPMDTTNEMALTDIGSALGEVAAIDILANQIISPNMLVAE